ncbi:maltose regulon repressor [Salmonella bongori]|nr:maltose regulon repressor [Salmonella bongori]
MRTLLKYGLPFHSEWVLECVSSQKRAAESITALLRYNPTISAVVCYNETIAMGAWFGLFESRATERRERCRSLFRTTGVAGGICWTSQNRRSDDLPIIWACTPAREIGYTLLNACYSVLLTTSTICEVKR